MDENINHDKAVADPDASPAGDVDAERLAAEERKKAEENKKKADDKAADGSTDQKLRDLEAAQRASELQGKRAPALKTDVAALTKARSDNQKAEQAYRDGWDEVKEKLAEAEKDYKDKKADVDKVLPQERRTELDAVCKTFHDTVDKYRSDADKDQDKLSELEGQTAVRQRALQQANDRLAELKSRLKTIGDGLKEFDALDTRYDAAQADRRWDEAYVVVVEYRRRLDEFDRLKLTPDQFAAKLRKAWLELYERLESVRDLDQQRLGLQADIDANRKLYEEANADRVAGILGQLQEPAG